MKVVWSPLAINRAAEETSFIGEDKPQAGRRWLEGLFTAVDRLEMLFPHPGHAVPELQSPIYRQLTCKSHRIIYRMEGRRWAYSPNRRFKP